MKCHGHSLSLCKAFVKCYLRQPPHGGRVPIILLRKTAWVFFFLMMASVAGVMGCSFLSIPYFTRRLVRGDQLVTGDDVGA